MVMLMEREQVKENDEERMKKAQELKAKEVASLIFDFHFEAEIFKNLSEAELLEMLDEKASTLKKEFKKPYAQLVAKRLRWLIEDRVEEQNLCPDCFKELEYRTIIRSTYYEPEESERYCEHCDWKEAM